ncbi:MAG: metal ABC transporter permease [Pirellulales bacterium]
MTALGDLLFPGGNPQIHTWAMATAAVVAAACGLVGTLLVVRRMSLLGDAIGHAVLPGIAVAVLAGGRPGGLFVFVGAVAAALATVWLTQGLRAAGGLPEDAGAGVVFTTLFAIGVLIVTAAPAGTHIDPACVLSGDLTFIPFDTIDVAGFTLPRAFVVAGMALVVLVAAAAITWKWQVFTAFDEAAARAAGVPVGAVTAGLLAATAVATVASFDAVGAVLVVTLLVAPAAAAELLVRRLHVMAFVAMALGITGACFGYVAAWWTNSNAAGMIAVVLGLEYVAAAVLAPEHGVLARAWGRLRLAWRVAREDALAAAWREEEASARVREAPVRRGSLFERLAATWLRLDGHFVREPGGWRLSAHGRRDAEVVVRSHRLWEAWLGRHADLPLDHLHPPAEWVEHHLGAAIRKRIEVETGWRQSDPHGREIPPEA